MRDKKREFAVHFGCSPFKSNLHQPSIAFALVLPVLAVLILLCVAIAADSGGS